MLEKMALDTDPINKSYLLLQNGLDDRPSCLCHDSQRRESSILLSGSVLWSSRQFAGDWP